MLRRGKCHGHRSSSPSSHRCTLHRSRSSRAKQARPASSEAVDIGSLPLATFTAPPLDASAVAELPPCRQGSVVPYSCIKGPDVWYGTQQRQQQHQWVHKLNHPELEELEAAVEAVTQKLQLRDEGNYLVGLMRLRDPAGFPLPLLQPVLDRMSRELRGGRGFFLLKGLPVQRWSRQQVLVAYWGLGLHLGVAVPQNQKGHLIGHVKDVGIDPLCEDPSTRIYMTRAAQPWHVDSCDIVGLLCLSGAKAGGVTSWASSSTIYNEMLRCQPEAVAALAGTWLLDRKGELPPGKPPVSVMPIVHFHRGYLTVTFHDSYYQAAASRHPHLVPPLTPQQTAALQLFNEIASRPDVRLDCLLEPGDVQWLTNHNIVHMRSEFEDWQEPERKRHLLRLWLVVPGLRPLPTQAFEDLWGPLAADDRLAAGLAALPDVDGSSSTPQHSAQGGKGSELAGNAAAKLAARFGGSGCGCIPLDAEVGNRLRD